MIILLRSLEGHDFFFIACLYLINRKIVAKFRVQFDMETSRAMRLAKHIHFYHTVVKVKCYLVIYELKRRISKPTRRLPGRRGKEEGVV